MIKISTSKLEVWLLTNRLITTYIKGAIALKRDGTSARVSEITSDEIFFDSISDFISKASFFRLFTHIEIQEDLYERIITELEKTPRIIHREKPKTILVSAKPPKPQNPDATRSTSYIQKRDSYRKNYIQHIKKVITDRGIDRLIHFTNIDNIRSIIENGIMPRRALVNMGATHTTNDTGRYDERTDCTSFSISYPNYLLMYKFKKIYNYEYAILEVTPSIMLNNSCIFHAKNAARSDSAPSSIEDLFSETTIGPNGNKISRADLKIPENFPTNPQAEILIKGIISPESINRIFFNSQQSMEMWAKNNDDLKIDNKILCASGEYFMPRCDFKFWQKSSGHEERTND